MDNSDDSMPIIHSVSDDSEDDSEYDSDDFESDSDDSEQAHWRESPRASRSESLVYKYSVYKLIPLTTSPAWDEIGALLNNRLKGPDSLLGLCDEARFARSHLKKTMSVLLKGSKQARAALFCLKQMHSTDITKELQIAFAKLLPHSLFHAEQLPELRTAVQQLQTQHVIYQNLTVETQKAITDYLRSTSGSRTAAQTVPEISSTRRPQPITKPLTDAASQKPSKSPNSSTAQTDQSHYPNTTQHMVHHQQLPTNLLTEQKTKAWNQLANLLSPLTELGFFQAHDSAGISPHDNIIPAKAMPLKWPTFFKREQQADVKQSDIVIVCVFPKHYRVSVLIPTTLAFLDQLE